MCARVRGRAFGLLSLSLTFVWCLSPLLLLCLSVVPAECRGSEGVVLRVAWLFVRCCAWPYPLVAAVARWYVSRDLRV